MVVLFQPLSFPFSGTKKLDAMPKFLGGLLGILLKVSIDCTETNP